MPFEAFDPATLSASDHDLPWIRLEPDRSHFWVNAAACQLLKQTEFVRLSYEASDDTILLDPTDAEDDDGYRVLHGTYSARIAARHFAVGYDLLARQRWNLIAVSETFVGTPA
jgi:hypothetical protein